MLRRALALSLLLSACSSGGTSLSVGSNLPQDGGKLKDEPRPISPEEDAKAPGMIPLECESLLNKSQEWGVAQGGSSWSPASPDQALEALRFFSTFHLVPESTSAFANAWLHENTPATDAEAKKSLDRMERAQSCDLLLAHQELLALVKFRWTRKQLPEVKGLFLRFVLNQQVRVAPSLARAVHVDVLRKAVARGFIRSDRRAIGKLQHWFDGETAKGLKRAEDVKSAREEWRLHQDEVKVSEEVRERLGRLLPLP